MLITMLFLARDSTTYSKLPLRDSKRSDPETLRRRCMLATHTGTDSSPEKR